MSATNASPKFSTSTTKTNGERNQVLRIKIGSAAETIRGDEATYRISYEVRGALRHFADHSELYWDVTGSSWDAYLNHVTLTVKAPKYVDGRALLHRPYRLDQALRLGPLDRWQGGLRRARRQPW